MYTMRSSFRGKPVLWNRNAFMQATSNGQDRAKQTNVLADELPTMCSVAAALHTLLACLTMTFCVYTLFCLKPLVLGAPGIGTTADLL